ncbi:response regulator [Aliarcobacter butzleri]|uniref:response regulator n=1 Tax=Aliarcobacter butzleri TaxID=28197 RepID=UPI000DB3CF7D|nr:response regulator [Aliarcobacter butzleri]MCG3651088.1 response regulator [Aliarcobacter butzleri]MDN5099517.1 response regulator [Aliarcobacter butzleri]PZP15075.1 MAG: response regulator [Aliarcobacter butzleri]
MKKINLHLFKHIKLLYVEDDLMTQEEVSFFLEKYLGELYLAKNGEEAINIFFKNKIDLIITDIQMPKMNGLEMSKRILEINPKIPIIITTAYNDCEYLNQAMDLGIDKYISKPFNLETLLTMIEKSLPLEHELKK